MGAGLILPGGTGGGGTPVDTSLFLTKADNLASVADPATARANLGATVAGIGAVPATHRYSQAEQHGYLAETFDPALATSALSFATGTLYVARLYVPKAANASSIVVVIATAGATLTAGQNLAGLYTDAGAQLSVVPDQATAWTSTGTKVMALGASQALAADTFVRVVLLAVGTTTPQFRSGSGSAVNANAGLSGAGLRTATASTGQSALPANITPGTLTGAGSFWVGLQ